MNPGGVSARMAHLTACAALAGLILLCLAWELWLAPLRPGGSWIALAAIFFAAAIAYVRCVTRPRA